MTACRQADNGLPPHREKDPMTITTDPILAQEAAEALGVSLNTVKSWFKVTGQPEVKDSRGRWRIDADTMARLHVVKNLRDSDNGYETIRRKLEPLIAAPDEALPVDCQPAETSQAPITPPAAFDPLELAQAITASVHEGVRRDNQVAIALSQATHRMGGLERDVLHLQADLAERDATIRELERRLAVPMLMPSPRRRGWLDKLLGR
jgi:hypothetical protein